MADQFVSALVGIGRRFGPRLAKRIRLVLGDDDSGWSWYHHVQMGLTLTLADFKGFSCSLALFGGVGLFVVMHFLAGIGHWMNLPRDMAVGLFLVSCCRVASNVVAPRANVALSVSMTAISTTLAVVLTPLLTKFYVGERVPVDAWGLLQSILIIVILPVTAGIVINHFFGKAAKRLNAVSPFVSVVFIILIVGYILSQNRESIIENWRVLVAAISSARGWVWAGLQLGWLFRLTSSQSDVRSRWCRQRLMNGVGDKHS